MDIEEINRYKEAYYENEYNANKQMTFACVFMAGILLLVWIGYMTELFSLSATMLSIVRIALPITILYLLSFLILLKFKISRRPWYKYLVLIALSIVMLFLNVILPKHALLGWALLIVLTNHYYNPKFGLIIFAIIVGLSFVALYSSMFFGEIDRNIFDADYDTVTGLIYSKYDIGMTWDESLKGRIEFLNYMRSIGHNRYLTAFLFYYLPRTVILALIFFISNSLNIRTYKIFSDGIKINSEHQKVNNELNIAKEIQMSSLPGRFVDQDNIEILGEQEAAKEVGGDLYDYFKIDDSHAVIVIGDVSGKGVPAAMFMMKTLTSIKNFSRSGRKPSEILNDVNASIFNRNEQQMFVTCFLGILDLKTGEFEFANAGHNHPLIGHDRDFKLLECHNGFILGGMEKCFVTDEKITLKKGDIITLYTDGITEARSKDGGFYGENRLLNVYNSKRYSCLMELHFNLRDSIEEFTKNTPQSDDMTIVSLMYGASKKDYFEKTFPAKKEELPALLEDVHGFSKKHSFKPAFANSLQIVTDELISNIIKYGYESKEGDIYIRLLYDLDDNAFVCTIVDKGQRFNPFLTDNKPVEAKNLETQKEGGLGILIVKKVMDEVSYDYINGKNIVVLKKKL